MPSVYGANIPPSLLPATPTTRSPPTNRYQPDQLNDFRQNDVLKSLADITDAVCPTGYKREVHEKAVILYKLERSENNHNIPGVTETIVIDEMLHVKLYKNSIPIPLPEWFRKGGDCRVKSKSILENFPTYIRNFGDVDLPDPKNIPREILDELQNLKLQKKLGWSEIFTGYDSLCFTTVLHIATGVSHVIGAATVSIDKSA